MENKKKAYTRPWFWLLIVLIVSVIIKAAENAEKVDTLLSAGDNYGEQEYIEAVKSEITEEPKQIVQENNESKTIREPAAESSSNIFHFIMNKSSKKYHTTDCTAAAKLTESNKEATDIEADSLEQAQRILEEQGYSACGRCFN